MKNAPLRSRLFIAVLFLIGASSAITHLYAQTQPDQFNRAEGTEFRLASYNIYFSSTFPRDDGSASTRQPDRIEEFARVTKAVDADIWMLQEILYGRHEHEGRTREGLLRAFQKNTPADKNDPSKNWNLALSENGRAVFSRYPILWSNHRVGRGQAVLIDLPGNINKKHLLIINQHFSPWKRNNDARVKQATEVVKFLERAKAGEEKGFPIDSDFITVIGGDFNSRTAHMPYRIISAQDINVSPKGELKREFDDISPLQLGSNPELDLTCGGVIEENGTITKYGGRIDFVLLQSGEFTPLNRFILNTLIRDDSWLKEHGLQKRDIALYPKKKSSKFKESLSGKFDHLPLVVDLKIEEGATH